MRLAYFQDMNECDPLPKLGRKVERDIVDHASLERAEAIAAFERMGNTLPPPIDLDLSKPESWPVVSFADAAEMAEAEEKKAPSHEDLVAAYDKACKRVGTGKAFDCWLTQSGVPGGFTTIFQYPAAIAALEALQ